MTLKEEFLKYLWPINKVGNADDIFNEVGYTLKYKTTIEGDPITITFLAEKYKRYINHMKIQNRDRDIKYHSKVMDIKTWLSENKFNEEYNSNNTELDDYLYGR